MSYRASVFQFQVFVIAVCLQLCMPAAVSVALADDNCQVAAGRLVSIQGEAQVLRNSQSLWNPVQANEAFCPGDTLRVGAGGRIAVVLANEAVLRIDQKSTLIFAETAAGRPSLLKLLNGVLHIFSHRPRSLEIVTPYVNGAVEGTEFLVQAGPGHAVITVFEGLVAAANDRGRLEVASGQTVVAGKGTAPKYLTVVRPRDATQWTLYYPAIVDISAGDAREGLAPPLRRAAEYLAVGRVAEAGTEIAGVLDKDPANSEALALLAIMEVVQNNKEQALHLASRAIASNPRSAAAGLALSYARQADFDIPGALAALETAEEFNPGNAEIKARLAELELSVGDLDKALETAREAARLNPNLGRIQTVLGFAHLTRIETEKAQTAFKKAIALDPALPLARLGLGLARIREGKLAEGRAEIEIAAALDPANALIRSYLGKAYYEEKRDPQSRRQYDIAKTLDPADPTPWFYDALRKQSLNRPVEALRDLQKSIELNDNRAVYRSRLLLDEDLAVRNVGLSNIYRELGFEKLALVDGVKSINLDPSNYSAHRFLSDIYSSQSRHEIARVSELLQSQLLQPVSSNPVHPQSAQSDLNIFRDTGLSDVTFNEYTPLFHRNTVSLMASGLFGGNDTWGDDVVVSSLWDNVFVSVGGMQYNTDGFRENNDQEQDLYNLFSKVALSRQTSLMAEYRKSDRRFGDMSLRFDPEIFYPDDRNIEDNELIRLGFHHIFSPESDLIGTAVLVDHDSSLELAHYNWSRNNWLRGGKMEMQQIVRSSSTNWLLGMTYLDTDDTVTIVDGPSVNIYESYLKTTRAYSYINIVYPQAVIWTAGVSGEILEGSQEDDSLHPKFGITWSPWSSTTLRVAVTNIFRGNLIDNQTLEPTNVAGFNQFFDDTLGTEAWRYGLAIDQKFGRDVFGGLEYSIRDLNVPSFNSQVIEIETDWQEKQLHAYLCWIPLDWFSTALEYFWDRHEHNMEYSGPEQVSELTTHSFPISVTTHFSNGLSVIVKATYVDQNGVFDPVPQSYVAEEGSDSFLIVDTSIRYRLPKRYGILSLEIKNLFDEQFQFQTMDPTSPEYVPEQLILGKLTISL